MNQNTYAIGGNAMYDWTLTRDNAGRITRRVENIQGSAITWDYQYDQIGRLTEVQQNGSIVESYTYDPNGNRLTEMNALRLISNQTYTYSAEDNVITAGTDTYQFDKDGFLTGKTTAAGTTTFNYSSRGELLNATLPDGRDISYVNDPMGRRIAKAVNSTVVEKYLWHGLTKLLAVYDGSNNLVVRFTYADGRMPVSMTQSGNTYYLAYDQVGSLRAVMDSTGAIVKQVDYDSFGSIINDSNPGIAVPFGFAGGLYDRDTGLVRFGFRDYDSSIGKWISKDPIDFDGGDANLFAYVGNNPVNKIDPYGLFAWVNPITYWTDLYGYARENRIWGHHQYPGEENSSTRHCVVSCMVASNFGTAGARVAGAGNELQGLVLLDIPNLKGRISGDQPWAFQWQDLKNNERGFRCSEQNKNNYNENDVRQTCMQSCR